MPKPSADPNRPRGCTCFRLRRTARSVTKLYDAHLAPAGLTLTQYSLISTLARAFPDAPPTVHEFSAMLNMDRTTMTRTLKPLIAARLVKLAAGEDRRRKEVQLTPAGREMFARAKPLWRAAQDEMLARLGQPRVAELHKLLDDSFQILESAT